MKLVFTTLASNELSDIKEYIAEGSLYYAEIFTQKILDKIQSIPFMPYKCRIVPEFNLHNVRELIFQNYRIVYRIEAEQAITILTIIHGSRQLNDIL